MNNSKNNFLFTSEAVSEGHPDKICDQIADKILDYCLANDENAKVACEVFATDHKIFIGGEFKLKFILKRKKIIVLVKEVFNDIGISKIFKKFKIKFFMQKQSLEINNAVNLDQQHVGAGDQGIMFGYAQKNDFNFMPPTLILANEALYLAAKYRKNKRFPFALADMKSQVTMVFNDQKQAIAIKKFILSIQHPTNYQQQEFDLFVKKEIIDFLATKYHFDLNFEKIINPTKNFSIGGTEADSGLTGRKIVVDNYGGFAPCGGGSFSGKDYTKVDRSAAYMCRFAAKNLVAANVCQEIVIQISYIIGQPKPSSYYVNTFNTGVISDQEIIKILQNKDIFDFSLSAIIKTLNLKKTKYYLSSIYNPFSNLCYQNFSWEQLNKVELIKKYLNKKKLWKI